MMANRYDEYDQAYEYDYDFDSRDNMKLLLTGLAVGALIGAGLMLFMAPDSGKKTMRKLRKKTMKLRDRAVDAVDERMEKARHRVGKVTTGVLKQADKMQHRGQDLLDEQRERVSDVVTRGREKMRMLGR